MKVFWSATAQNDLDAIFSYLEARNPGAAERFLALLLHGADSLTEFPDRGAPGHVAGTRELRVHHPYVIVYRNEAHGARILRIWHAAQDRG